MLALGAATCHLDAPPSCLFRAAGFVGPFVRLMRRCGWPLRAAAKLVSYVLQIWSSQTQTGVRVCTAVVTRAVVLKVNRGMTYQQSRACDVGSMGDRAGHR